MVNWSVCYGGFIILYHSHDKLTDDLGRIQDHTEKKKMFSDTNVDGTSFNECIIRLNTLFNALLISQCLMHVQYISKKFIKMEINLKN